jgi:hypothetical protein
MRKQMIAINYLRNTNSLIYILLVYFDYVFPLSNSLGQFSGTRTSLNIELLYSTVQENISNSFHQ